MERITSWLFSSGGAWTSLEAYPDGSEAGTGWSSSTMVAVAPDLREFCVSAVEQMAIDNKLLANSDELSINEAASDPPSDPSSDPPSDPPRQRVRVRVISSLILLF